MPDASVGLGTAAYEADTLPIELPRPILVLHNLCYYSFDLIAFVAMET